MKKYNPQEIEKRWQDFWEKNKTFQAKDNSKKPKKFVLVEFPYPSGAGLHMGHLRPYVAADVYARYHRMRGFETLFPIGWDAFGLPAENYAIKMGVHPSITTKKNVANAKKQMQSWGLSFDWSREINTTDPEYYKWTQWLFLQFYKKGLAYESTGLINWCPKDKTGLANEEVIDGKCERCGTVVEKKELRQWYLKITEYAEKLLEGLKNLPQWPEAVKLQQENWIGKKTGINISYEFDTKINFVILHGYKGRPEGVFIPWIKTELEKKGFKVQVPVLPNPDSPTEKEQVEHVLKNCIFDENTVLVGHSLGGTVAMKVLQKLGKKIKKLVLIAPAIEPKFHNAPERPFWKNFSWENLDYQRISKLSEYRIVVSDLKEIHRKEYLEYLTKKIGGVFVSGTSENEHFTQAQEPLLLKILLPDVTCFTTRPDTNFGATFVVLGPEHPYLTDRNLLGIEEKYWKEITKYQQKVKNMAEEERLSEGRKKTGVFTGLYLINSLNNYKMPVFVSDYVLGNVGTGAVVGVPGHDKRDFEFAQVFKIPVVRVVQKNAGDVAPIEKIEQVQEEEGTMVNSEFLNGLNIHEATEKIMDYMEAQGYGKRVTNYKLRDWVFSRQRYWGEPIPLIHCEDCGVVPVPEKDLPVKLPNVKKYEPTGTGESPLADILKWVKTKCPKCGKLAWRETNTMPQWAGSSWYWLRYADSKNKKKFSDLKKQSYWSPVDVYFGGMEHTTLHLLYSRFWNLFLYDQGLVAVKEPYALRKPHGIVLGPDGEKMSKSRGNVVDPQGVVKQYGADVLRMYEMFLGPHEAMVAFNDKGIVGVARFLDRVWNWVNEIAEAPHQKKQEKRDKRKEKSQITKFLLLHGKGGSPTAGVLPWLKKELESKGFIVEVPTLPNPEAPNDVEQTEYVLKNCKIDSTTAILGHSFGGVVALRLLEKGAKPGQVVLAATPFSGKFLDNKERPTVTEALKKGFDFKTISKNCKNFVALYDTSDYVVPMSDGQSFADGLKTQLVKVKSEKSHFNGEKEPNVFTALIPDIQTEVKNSEKVERELNKLIKKVTGDIESFSFNTCISAFMEFHNAIKDDFITLESVKKFLVILYPFAPHIAEELYQKIKDTKTLGREKLFPSLQQETWPEFDATLIIDKEVEMVVQINGKVRGKIKVPSGSLEDFVKTEVQKLDPVKQSLVGESIKRVIFVKDRLINLVI